MRVSFMLHRKESHTILGPDGRVETAEYPVVRRLVRVLQSSFIVRFRNEAAHVRMETVGCAEEDAYVRWDRRAFAEEIFERR
jgi:hypothetical protein